jgi:hypothetical protein
LSESASRPRAAIHEYGYRLIFLALLAGFLVYGWSFIQRTAFEIDGARVYALFDDAMVSMQYAKNLANGDGLVWNAGGERVEGYSNPLWVLLMAGIHLFPIPLTMTSLYVKLGNLLILLLNLIVVKRITEHFTINRLLPILAAALAAFYFPLNNWSLQGMEVGFIALLLSGAVLLGLNSLTAGRFSPWPYLLLAAAVLTRMDAAVLLIACGAIMAWLDGAQRRRHLAWGLGSLLIPLGALTAFRLAYYGAWLPNTYALKLGGISTILRVSLGLRLLADFLWESNWILFALPFLLLALSRDRRLMLLFGVILAQMAYSVYVGGDSWEHVGGANRFIASVMPLFFVLFILTLGKLLDLAWETLENRPNWGAAAGQAALVLLTALSLFNFNTLQVQDSTQRWTLIKKPVFTESVERYAEMGIRLGQLTTPDAVIAVITAGNIPYFSERTSIDMLGKNDPVIAGGPARIYSSLFQPGDFRPGHNKWDYAYSIGELQPDVVAQFWENTETEVAPYLVDYEIYVVNGIPYYFRTDSEKILWDQLPPQN